MEETKTVEFSNVVVTITVKPKKDVPGVAQKEDTSLPGQMSVI